MNIWSLGDQLDPSHQAVELVKSDGYAMYQDRQGVLYVTDEQGIVQFCGRDLSSAEKAYQKRPPRWEREHE